MPSIFDTLQVVFWSLTYITIIVCGVKHPEEHKPMMPYIAGGLNLAWELNALLLYHHYGHIIWSGLDIMIFVLNLRNLKRHGKHRQYILYVIVAAATIYGVFKLPSGMLISSYTLDLIMAIEYVVCSKEISVHGNCRLQFSNGLVTCLRGCSTASRVYSLASLALRFSC